MSADSEPSLEQRFAGMIASSMRTYPEHTERAALRCAMGDAAHICDMLAAQMLEDTRGRGGKGAHTILGKQLSAAMKTCGDKIWALRDQINVKDSAS